jgi:transposase
MLNDFNCSCPIYIACGYTDLRRGIDGLAGIVQSQFELDPCTPSLFLFCGRRLDRLKALYWEGLSAHFCYPNHYEEWHCFCWFLG